MESAPLSGTRPRVSVIITSYNYAHYIGESISSVLAQSFRDLELIVVDNASTDNTDEVVGQFADDARLRYIKNDTNIGLTPNHNRALTFVRGDFVVFVSADDKLLPGHLQRSVNFLDSHPGVDMVYGGVVFINAESRPYDVRGMSGQLPVDYDGGRNEFAAQLAEGCYIAWPSMVARRALFDELGHLENITAADFEITVRWAAAGKRFGYMRTPSVCIRLHAPQASGASYVADGRDLDDYLAILEKFVLPDHAGQLSGFTQAIARHLGLRTQALRNLGKTVPTAMAERIDAINSRLAAMPKVAVNEALHGRPMISVVMRVETVAQMLLSLSSLEAQQDAPAWEAVVVAEGSPDFTALLQSLPYTANVRYVRLDDKVAPALARNVGIRLSAGRIITYLEPGNVFSPNHFAQLATIFASPAVWVVRSGARVLLDDTQDGTPNTLLRETPIAGITRGNDDDDRDLVAGNVPIDAIAHRAGAIERAGSFNVDIPTAEVWEFWLRLRGLGVSFNPESGVHVRIIRQRVQLHAAYLGMAQTLHRAYPVPPGHPVDSRRALYLEAVSNIMERGAAAVADDMSAAQSLAVILGVENARLSSAAST